MALAPQRGAGLMSLMVGMSIGLGVLLLANEQLRQLGARYRANQARDQETESFRGVAFSRPPCPRKRRAQRRAR